MSGQIQGNILVPVFQCSHCVVLSKGRPSIIDQHINVPEQGRFLVNFLNISFAGDVSRMKSALVSVASTLARRPDHPEILINQNDVGSFSGQPQTDSMTNPRTSSTDKHILSWITLHTFLFIDR